MPYSVCCGLKLLCSETERLLYTLIGNGQTVYSNTIACALQTYQAYVHAYIPLILLHHSEYAVTAWHGLKRFMLASYVAIYIAIAKLDYCMHVF